MKKKTRVLYRISSLLLMLLMIMSVFCTIPFTASAATVTKSEKNYDIAVVFDNSGSMYQNQGWCRAKYAMEIFASMLNYDKDKLHIFPMWEVTTDGSQPNSGGSYAAIEVKSKKDIDKISNLYTVRPSNTPFAPITEAYNYLKTSTADEKWLVILTDGEFNQEARGQGASIDLQKRVSSLASKEIKVQYLGFGGATALKANEANNFFAKKSSDTSLKDDLIGICNSIFQRSVLPSNRLNGEKLNLDLSMKNVIVFAQGANAKITSLKDSSGKEVAVSLDSGRRKYSDIKAKGYADAPIDTSLVGQVVTFTACPKGEYTLSYTGADKIQIFYEPDVDIDISFTNSDGQKIEKPEDFVAGEYTVNSKIVDASTREDVTSHELMGKDVKLSTYVKTSKDSERKEYANGSKINFEPDDSTEIWVEGEYLGKYKISSKDDKKWDWLNGIEISPETVDFKIDATVLQSQSWFKTKDHDNWKPIRVAMTLKGQPLTDEQLAKVKLSITTSGDLKYRCEPILGESAYNVYIAQDENGKYIEPETGKYKLNASATYIDEYGEETTAKDDVSFEIQWYSKFWRWLIILIILLLLVLLAIFILTRKAWPKEMYFSCAKGTSKVNIGKSTNLVSNIFPNVLLCSAEKSSILMRKFGKQASIKIVKVDPAFNVKSFKIGSSSTFVKDGTKYIDSKGKEFKEVFVRHNTKINVEFTQKNKQPISGKICMNSKK